MTRYKAFAIHLAISVAIISALTGLFIWLWFPLPYFMTEGGWQGLRLIALVDCVIGPAITLVVYNPKKSRRELFFDLTVIALMQLLAMGAGLYTVSSKRIVASVYSDGSFHPVSTTEASLIGGKLTELIKSSKTTPAYVVVDLPDGLDERQKMRRESMASNIPLFTHEELMVPFGEAAIKELRGDDLPPLEMPYIENKEFLAKYLKESRNSHESHYFIRTISPYGDYLVILSRDNFELTDWLVEVYKEDKAAKATP